MGAPEEVGHVTEKWWETKKICDWTYESPMPIEGALFEKLGPPVAAVNLESPRSKDSTTHFRARSPWFGGKRSDGIVDQTLEGLKKKVEQAFRDQILAHTEVKWEDWIELEIQSRDVSIGEDEGSAIIHIDYKILKRAKFPDGRDMVLDRSSLQPFPKEKAAGEERRSLKSYGRDYHQSEDAQYAYIKATPENLEAVKTLMNKLGEVNERLLAVLAQGSITKTIAQLTGGQLRLEKK